MTQHSDIADDLGVWLAQMVKDAPDRRRAGELPQIEIELVQRAIVEINRLREQLRITPHDPIHYTRGFERKQ
jgi:hypothetical protein